MERLKWLIFILVVGIVLNLVLLDFQFFELRNKYWGIALRVREISSKKQEKKEASEGFSLTPSLPSYSQEAVCSANCLQEIEKIRSELKKITPAVIKEIQKTETATTQTSSVKEIYINFGSGETTSQEWEDIPGLAVNIDSNNYQKIKSVKFIASLRIPTANGWVYARLFNKTDKHPLWFSEVSSEGPVSTLKESGNITLDSGKKLYQVQMKTTMGAKSIIDAARVKIILE